MKYGFHEDGFTAGIEAAKAAVASSHSGINLPFELVRDVDEPLKKTRELALSDRLLASIFDILEYTAIRITVGRLLGVQLKLVRFVLGFFCDTDI